MTSGDLTRFRVMAYVTGVFLLVLVFVAVPVKYLGHDGTLVSVVGPVHGWLYLLYLVTASVLAYKLRWPGTRTALVLLAGTVPFASFVAERAVVAALRTADAQKASAATANSHH